MITLYLGGVGKSQVKEFVEKSQYTNIKVVISNDFSAGSYLKKDPTAYYIGTCHTGAGGSLGALLALLGREKCHTFGRKVKMDEKEIIDLVKSGVKAFGLSVDQIDVVVPRIVDTLKAYHQ